MSKVQFNLLPDVKLEYNRTKHLEKTVVRLSLLAGVVSLAIFLTMLLMVNVVQKRQMDNSSKAVDAASQKLKAIPGIDQIITVQSQLQALSQLHQSKHALSQIFVYLPEITPADVSINKLDIDTTQSTMIISGTANSQQAVNTFVDTLKTTTYAIPDVKDQKGCSSASGQWNNDKKVCSQTAFPSVVESSFSINPTNAGYTINLQYDTKLFANNLVDTQGKAVSLDLSVKQTNPPSRLNDPASTLFNSSQTSTEGR